MKNVTFSTRVLIFKFSFFNVANWKCFAQMTSYSRINNEIDIEKNYFQFNNFHETHIIWKKNCFFSLKYNILFNQFDIKFWKQDFFYEKSRTKFRFRNKNQNYREKKLGFKFFDIFEERIFLFKDYKNKKCDFE